MPPYQTPPRRWWLSTVIILALILMAGIGYWWWQQRKAPYSAVKTEDNATSVAHLTAPIESSPVISQGDLQTPAEPNELMAQRKTQLGIESGVDMIVREDETIQIGDIRIPMTEILEKIRIKEGEIVEKELIGTPKPAGRPATPATVRRRQAEIQDRLAEIEKLLADPRVQANQPLMESLQTEQGNLRRTEATIQRYLDTLEQLAELEQQISRGAKGNLSQLQTDRAALLQSKADLEKSLKADPYWDGAIDAYGIHIVRPGDNIWNIHFQFLRNYFARKGIDLAPTADEPLAKGMSSGVGKILKFSENMVHIYNLRQRRLEMNLDTIHPLSKIVIFNLARVFAMLKQIDYGNVHRIEFDGETLWIPSDG